MRLCEKASKKTKSIEGGRHGVGGTTPELPPETCINPREVEKSHRGRCPSWGCSIQDSSRPTLWVAVETNRTPSTTGIVILHLRKRIQDELAVLKATALDLLSQHLPSPTRPEFVTLA